MNSLAMTTFGQVKALALTLVCDVCQAGPDQYCEGLGLHVERLRVAGEQL